MPANPEQLMRSRFTAFYLGEAHYLFETLHPSKRGKDTHLAINNTINTTKWHSLRVLSTQVTNNEKGQVTFVAFFSKLASDTKSVLQLHEQSNFVYDTRWFYVDGVILPSLPLGRNDMCWCGSGQKLKKCHGDTTV